MTSPQIGAHRVAVRFDARQRLVEETFYAADGKPRVGRAGHARKENRYGVAVVPDEVRTYVVGPDGSFVLSLVAGPGNFVREQYFHDDAGRPAVDPTTGAHRCTNEPDEHGRPRSTAYFDQYGNPCAGSNFGAHRIEREIDEGVRHVERYFGTDGKPADNAFGVAQIENFYEAGKLKSATLWKWSPTAGYVLWRRTNAANKPLEERYYDAANRPGRAPATGVHRTRFCYADNGQLTEVAVFDTEDRPMLDPQTRAHRGVMTFAPGGSRPSEGAFFGVQSEPVLCALGYHRRVYHYNFLGVQAGHTDYDTDGKVIPPPPK